MNITSIPGKFSLFNFVLIMKKTGKYLVIFMLLFWPGDGFAQTNEEMVQKALNLKSELRFEESLNLTKQLLKTDSNNFPLLNNASYLYSKLGFSKPTTEQKTGFYKQAEYLALKAVKINPKSPEAHYSYLVALGRLTELASNKQKIRNAKIIRAECETILQLQPQTAGVWHILGRWHREIAGLNSFERFMIDKLMGGMPEGGSYDEAIICFTKAINFEPENIFHYYELALSYYRRDNDYHDRVAAKLWLERALQLDINEKDADQVLFRKQCEKLLENVK